MKTTKYPMSVDSLEKGDYLTPEQCEEITTYRRGSTRYQFALQSLRELIYTESARAGMPLSCGIEGDGIRIHTDSEAAIYHRDLHYRALGSMRRSAHRMVHTVQRGALTEAEASAHDRETALAALRIGAVRKVARIASAKTKQIQEAN